MVQTATALLACGRAETARRALVYLACTQQPDGGFAQNFWIDGTPYWSGLQLDEVAFPLILAWRLWKADALGEMEIFPFVERAAGFLVRHAPITHQERWEENAGYSPSTLAAVIAGLICAAEMARAHDAGGDWPSSSRSSPTGSRSISKTGRSPTTACCIPRSSATTCASVRRSAARPTPTKAAARRRSASPTGRRARAPSSRRARLSTPGFLELVRYGVRRADDPLIVDSLKVVDAVLKRDLPQGPGWLRYNCDGYGQRADGGPFQGWGQGRVWPLLTGERAHYELAAGNGYEALDPHLRGFATSGQMMPEQVWDEPDMPDASMRLGQPAGSAVPLVWAHAEYLKLLRSAPGRQGLRPHRPGLRALLRAGGPEKTPPRSGNLQPPPAHPENGRGQHPAHPRRTAF